MLSLATETQKAAYVFRATKLLHGQLIGGLRVSVHMLSPSNPRHRQPSHPPRTENMSAFAMKTAERARTTTSDFDNATIQAFDESEFDAGRSSFFNNILL